MIRSSRLRFSGKGAAIGVLSGLSLIPWILFGLLGPNSDALWLLEAAAGKYGLLD